MISHRNIFVRGCCLIIFFLAASLIINDGVSADKTDQAAKPMLSLKVAVMLGKPKTILSFSLTNNGPKEVEVTPVGTTFHPIVIVKPNGEEKTIASAVTMIKPGVVKPAQTVNWAIDITELFDLYKHAHHLEEPGLYRISSRFVQFGEDKPEIEYKSNEVLLIKEK